MKKFNFWVYILVSLIVISCGGKSDIELFEEGMSLIDEKQYDEAANVFEKISEDYPKSELAAKAIFESAKLYQGQVIKNISERASLVKSVELYKKVYNNYASSDAAENALFMAGFILANELTELNAARQTYELYLEKYPNGQLADDARVELQNLGKTPEQILMEKMKNENPDEKAI